MAGKSRHEPIVLLNCRECDDILRITEGHARTCECGKSAARFAAGTLLRTGPSRVIEIDIEEYDGAAPGEDRKWRVRE